MAIYTEAKIKQSQADKLYTTFKQGDLTLKKDFFNWIYTTRRRNKKVSEISLLQDAISLINKKKFKEANKLLKEFYSVNTTTEETTSGDVAAFSSKVLPSPLIRVPANMFFEIGYADRNSENWFSKFPKISQWCRENKGKHFIVKHESQELFLDCIA